MKLAELDAAARRMGPIKAIDEDLVPVTDFSAGGAKTLSINGGAFAAAAGDIEPILNPDDSPSGFVYYQATEANAAALGFATLRLADVCLERVLTEWIEALPQGIPAGTEDDELLHVPLEAKDFDGVAITSAVGLDVHISINGAKLEVPANALTHLGNGLWDLLLDPAEVTEIGWVFVRLGGTCQEFGIRVDVVDPDNMVGGGDGYTPPFLGSDFDDQPAVTGFQGGDIALTWANELGSADMSMTNNDITTDRGLRTAVLLSLFTDRRAQDDDVPPSGDPTDRRGWWADEFAEVEGDLIGSRIWLLSRSKATNETALRLKEYALEALAWMVEDRVVESINVPVEISGDRLLWGVELQRPGKDPVTYRFAHVWDALAEAVGS